MIDFRSVRNEKIIRAVRRKLYNIICEDVKHYDDENALKHIEMFMEGVSWATGLRYAVKASGEVYLYFRSTFDVWCTVIDVYLEIKILRNSINRHYSKIWGVSCYECY